jgi:hypothetical protein
VTPKNNPKKEPEKRDDALERQIQETKRREHEKHLTKYRKPNPNTPH